MKTEKVLRHHSEDKNMKMLHVAEVDYGSSTTMQVNLSKLSFNDNSTSYFDDNADVEVRNGMLRLWLCYEADGQKIDSHVTVRFTQEELLKLAKAILQDIKVVGYPDE
tara:strand:+ start:822 stop:1145 length:324 start_codon:yes stop_codon:yes gene_type:complete